jgi:FkbM family methyltransferase
MTTMCTKLIQKLFVKYLHAPWNFGKKEAQVMIDLLRPQDTFLINGVKLSLSSSNYIDRKLLFSGHFDPYLEKLISNLTPDDVFLDVGANFGYFTLLAARQGASVMSFEPSARELGRLYGHLVLNPDLLHRVQVFPSALGDVSCTTRLRMAGDGNTGQNFVVKDGSVSADDVVITQRTWIDAVPTYSWQNISLVKIDVEGFEGYALQSLAPLLDIAENLAVYIEITPSYLAERSNWTAARIEEFLGERGFRSVARVGDSRQWDELFLKGSSRLVPA